MVIRSRLLAAAMLLVLSAAAAAASPAVTERSVHLRAGPGTAYRVVGTLPRNAAIDVGGCTSGWCEVRGGTRTYVAQNFVVLQGTGSTVVPAQAYESDDYPGFDFPGTTAYAPVAAPPPRWTSRRWSAWRHRYGRSWTMHSYQPGAASGTSGSGAAAFGKADGSALSTGAARSAEPGRPTATVGSAMPDAARPVPPLPIPNVSSAASFASTPARPATRTDR